ncbi:MAG: hypothetical protein OXF49_00460 [Candidatus Saccharibacteria bacterium]|nr:hypothetical protein [Candidatus Saccharibacteria bacterium]
MLNRIIKTLPTATSYDLQLRQQRITQLQKALKRTETAVWSITNQSQSKSRRR